MLRDWIRRIFIDPELERKAHEFANKANRTAEQAEQVIADAQQVVNEARIKVRSFNPAQIILVIVVCILGAGAIIGSLWNQSQPTAQ